MVTALEKGIPTDTVWERGSLTDMDWAKELPLAMRTLEREIRTATAWGKGTPTDTAWGSGSPMVMDQESDIQVCERVWYFKQSLKVHKLQ